VPEQAAPADAQFVAEISDMAREILALEARQDEVGTDLRAKQDALKARLREKGVRKIPGVLTWSHVKGRTSYDNKAIQAEAIAAGIDIEQFRTTGEPSDRLTISLSSEIENPQAAA
jgi:hypothetical protein